MCTADGQMFGSVAEALRMTRAGLGYLNGRAGTGLDAASCGEVLTSPGEIQGKFTAARATVLSRFDAACAHSADGYATSAAWLYAMANMSSKDARATVRQTRTLRRHPSLGQALAAGEISASWAAQILHVGSTFDGAGTLRGDLTPECAAAVQAVLEALGKKAGPEDARSEGQRFHDALQLGCELLIRAKMVPGRAGADTQVLVHIPFGQLRGRDGASAIEEAWLAGGPGSLTGKDAEAAACDALTVPVVTGHADMTVIDKIIALALAAHGLGHDADPDPDGDLHDSGLDGGIDGGDLDGGGTGDAGHDLDGSHANDDGAGQSGNGPGGASYGDGGSGGSPWTSSPAPPASPAGCAPPCSHRPTANPPCRWTSATPTPSRPASAAPSGYATAAAPGPAAEDPPPGATYTTPAQEGRRRNLRQPVRPAMPVPPRHLHPPLGLATHPAPRRHHHRPRTRRADHPQPLTAHHPRGITRQEANSLA